MTQTYWAIEQETTVLEKRWLFPFFVPVFSFFYTLEMSYAPALHN